jgi:hypothetical protein
MHSLFVVALTRCCVERKQAASDHFDLKMLKNPFHLTWKVETKRFDNSLERNVCKVPYTHKCPG